LDLEPDAETGLRLPDRRHLGPGVARNHHRSRWEGCPRSIRRILERQSAGLAADTSASTVGARKARQGARRVKARGRAKMAASIRGQPVGTPGATSGIGQLAAERLATMGARLVLVARSRQRGEEMLARLAARGPGVAHTAHYADLGRIAEVKRVGAEIAAAEPRIDVLINNAGGMFATRRVTEDGLERTFALNHMGYFILTHCLRERLAAAAPAR